MRCSRVQFLYEEYSAGTLVAVTASRVDQHLATCAECREYFEESDDISQIISGSSEVVHPGNAYMDDLTSRVMESLYDETGEFRPASPRSSEAMESPGRSAQRPLWWAGAIAATLLLVPMVAGSLNRPGESSSEEMPRVSQSPATMGTTVAKSVQRSARASSTTVAQARNLEPGVWGSALPLGQGLVYNVIRPVSMHPNRPSNPVSAGNEPKIELGTIEELLALEAVGTVEARQRIIALLRDLGEMLHNEYPELETSSDLILMKQTHLYHGAEKAIQSGDVERASELYGNILRINPSTILARRAAMRLAELNDYERGDYLEALKYYRLAEGETAQLALTEEEALNITLRREQLEKHAANDFASLKNIQQAIKAPWGEVPGLIAPFLADASCQDVAGDLAVGLMNRLASGSLPSDQIAFELVDLIEGGFETWDNPESKSWVQLLLGDIIWLNFESSEPALAAYHSAQVTHARSESATLAQKRIDLLQKDKVVVFGR